jgi:hypothetical protein
VKNSPFIFITYDPSFNAFLMLTIDLFLTIVRLLGLPPSSQQRAGTWVIRQEGDLRGFGCREGFGRQPASQRRWSLCDQLRGLSGRGVAI